MKYLTYLITVMTLLAFGQIAYGACTCDTGCNGTSITAPFSTGGVGEFCFTATDLGAYIQSWGCDKVEITGVDYTNLYVPTGDLIRDTDGKYYIYYKASSSAGSFQATGDSVVSCCPACNSVWCSCEKYGDVTMNGYIMRNDIWGSEGPQCIWVNSPSNWGVHATFPETSGVKSYPHVAYVVNKNISAMGSCTSTFNVTVPTSGSHETTWDIWLPSEVMIWMNKYGAVGPIAGGWDDLGTPIPSASNVTVGGHTWDVYHGGSNVVSFVRQGNVTSGTVDIAAILNWIKNQGWIGDGPVSEIQFGFEITSAPGGLSFTCNSYSIGSGGATTTSTTAASTTSTTAASTTSTTTAASTTTTSTASTTTTAAATTTSTTATTTTTTTATTTTSTTAASTTTTASGSTTTTTAASTSTTASGQTCSPVDAAITAPFTKDGTGTFCWTATACSYINSWSMTTLTVNGVDFKNKYASSSQLPAKINSNWYIYYSGSSASHFELK